MIQKVKNVINLLLLMYDIMDIGTYNNYFKSETSIDYQINEMARGGEQ